MEINDFEDSYLEHLPNLQRLEKNLLNELESDLTSKKIKLAIPIEHRIKSLDSMMPTILSSSELLLLDFPDLIGFRLIVTFQSELEQVEKLIESKFKNAVKDDKSKKLVAEQFGYQSYHYDVKIPKEWLTLALFRNLGAYPVEIQVRTIAQHAWAMASHRLQYKREADVPESLQRDLARAAAHLESVDEYFEKVFRGLNNYLEDNQNKDSQFNVETLKQLLDAKLPRVNAPEQAEYSELLTDLKTFGYETVEKMKALIDDKLALALEGNKRLSNAQPTVTSVDKNVWLTNTALVRSMLALAHPREFSDYTRNKYSRRKKT